MSVMWLQTYPFVILLSLWARRIFTFCSASTSCCSLFRSRRQIQLKCEVASHPHLSPLAGRSGASDWRTTARTSFSTTLRAAAHPAHFNHHGRASNRRLLRHLGGNTLCADMRVHRPIRLPTAGSKISSHSALFQCESSHHRTAASHLTPASFACHHTCTMSYSTTHTAPAPAPAASSVSPPHPVSKSSGATPPLVTSASCARRPTTMGTTPAPRTSVCTTAPSPESAPKPGCPRRIRRGAKLEAMSPLQKTFQCSECSSNFHTQLGRSSGASSSNPSPDGYR